MLRRFLRIAVISILFVTVAPLAASAGHRADFDADLDPGQEVQDPAVVSDGEGDADFTVKRNRVRFKLKWDDLTSDAVMAHIHCAPAGSNGDVGVTLFAQNKGDDGRVRGSFRGPDPGNACGWSSLGDVLAAMVSGNAYVNVHTTNFPGGEIRGQIEPEDIEFEADLDPDQEIQDPAVISDGEGEAEFRLKRGKVRFELEWDDLTSNAVMAHIHCAPAGANGVVGVTLFAEEMDDEGKVRGSFTGPDAGNGCNWATLGDVLGAMAGGDAYVNVHSVDFPAGEVRGQIEID